MWAAAQRHPEVVTQVVPSPITLPVDNTVRRLIGEGYLGRILTVEVRAANGAFLDAEAPLHWRQDIELSGLNVMSLGIWYEALMRWIGDATDVAAKGKIFVGTRRDPLTGAEKPVEIPEQLVVLADMAEDDLCLLRTHVSMRLRVGDVDAMQVERLPTNEASEWEIVLPRGPVEDAADFERRQDEVLATTTSILLECSVLMPEKFEQTLKSRFESGLSTKAFVVQSYDYLYRMFWSSEATFDAHRAAIIQRLALPPCRTLR